MREAPIPFNSVAICGREYEYMRQAAEDGYISASGPFSQRASAVLRDELGAAEVFLTTSCTAALEMVAMLLEPKPGDTVIVPSFTFVSTALAFAREGFGIVFADIEDDTLGIDPAHVAALIDDTTRAVVAVHYGGVACHLDGLQAVLARHPEVELIEDNAHGLFGSHNGEPLGSFGRFSTLSFHETKNLTCGEGGALVINQDADIERARVLLDKGTDRQRFLMGEVDKYSWRDLGSSFGMSDLNAAFLYAQIEQRVEILKAREWVFESYLERIAPMAAALELTLPKHRAGDRSGYHLFHVLTSEASRRPRILTHMRASGIQATFHYIPLHSSVGGVRFAARRTECPTTDDVSSRLIRLPFYRGLIGVEIDRVVEALKTAIQTAA